MSVEPRTETQALEQRITQALITIRREWDAMLPVGAPGRSPGGPGRAVGIAGDNTPPEYDSQGRPYWRSDHADTNLDIDPTTTLVALRRAVLDSLNGWTRVIMNDRPVTKALPDGLSVPSMCDFLARHAQWMSGHEAALDMASEVADLARECSRYGPPPIVEKAIPRTYTIGSCPLDIGEGERSTCSGRVIAYPEFTDHDADPWAQCSRCGERAVASVWEKWMFPEAVEGAARDRPLTIGEVVTLAHREFGKPVTKRAIWHWVSRGQLEPIDRSAKPHTFRLGDVVDFLAAKVG